MKPLGTQLVAEFIYCAGKILNDREALERMLKRAIQKSGLTLKSITGHQFHPVGVTVIAVISESHIGIHTYPEARHASVDIFTCAAGSRAIGKLLDFLKKQMQPKTVRVVELSRGNPLEIKKKEWITCFSGSGFETKYHIKKKLLSKRTKYQMMDIIENDSFGRMLFLDKDLQIAESDAHVYNENMVRPVIRKGNSLRKVAILGGGDGGVLNEILKYRPREVFLVEIDKEVIRASKKLLKSICGTAFQDKRVNLVIDDANNFLAMPHGFDAVVYDLTMHPESITKTERTGFLEELLSKLKGSLNSGGVVSLQCGSEFDVETQRLLQKILPRHFRNVVYRKSYIPSFCENWVFAAARVKHA